MERAKTVRNIAIIALIAAAVFLLPGGDQASHTAEGVLQVLFGLAIAFIALRFYRERRMTIHSLGDGYRALLYGALAAAAVLALAKIRMWETGSGELVWFIVAGGVVYALIAVFRRWRSY
jgi:predicted membrane channel-forming protein YqfA (hemolysin III family)